MSEIIKKICVGEDTKTLVLKIHGDLGSLEIDNCGCSDKKKKDDSGKSKDAGSGSDKTPDTDKGKNQGNSLSNNISLIGPKGKFVALRCVSALDGGFLAGGGGEIGGVLTELDENLNFKKAILFGDNVTTFKALRKEIDKYIIALEYRNGGGFIVWDSNYKTISSYHISHSVQGGGNIPYIIRSIHKADKDFSGEASYLCAYDTKGSGNIVVAFDKNYKKVKFVSTPGQNDIDLVVSKDKIVGFSSIDNKGYIFITDANLTVNKQVIYTVEKNTCIFRGIAKTENGYLVLGELGQTDKKGNLLLLKLDEDLKILDKKVIGCPFTFTIKSFNQRPDGGYLITGETKPEPKYIAFMIALDKDLNIINKLSLAGSTYDAFLDGFQKEDGTYVFSGYTQSVGYGHDGFIATFKGDLSKLHKQKMVKYPSLVIDCELELKVHTDVVIEVNDKPDYKPNYEKLYSGHELKFDSVKSDGTVSSGIMVQDANMGISGS